MPDDLMIEAEELAKSYGETRALAGVDFCVPGGRILGLLGPNGAGKTTAVRILTILALPDAGRARVAGIDVAGHPAEVRRHIGVAAQDATLDGLLTGRQNLVLAGELSDMRRTASRQRATELLAQFELTDAADRVLKGYSGMRRRLDLAAAVMTRPPVLFLDEPTTGLDPVSRQRVWEAVRELTADGVTVLLTTQYLDGGIPHPARQLKDFALAGLLALNLVTSTMGTAVGLSTDLHGGIIDRFRALPMWQAAVLAGRSFADLMTSCICALIVAVTGLAVGWRPDAGAGPVIGGLRPGALFRLLAVLDRRLTCGATQTLPLPSTPGRCSTRPTQPSSGQRSSWRSPPHWPRTSSGAARRNETNHNPAPARPRPAVRPPKTSRPGSRPSCGGFTPGG